MHPVKDNHFHLSLVLQSHLQSPYHQLPHQTPYTGSKICIVTTDSAFLDRQYTVFGCDNCHGMETTSDAIVKLEKDGNDCPLQDAYDQLPNIIAHLHGLC